MKLNKMQLEAISTRLAEEIQAENRAFNKVITDSENSIVESFLQNFPVLLEYRNFHKSTIDFTSFFKSKYPEAFAGIANKKDTNSLKYKIENDIVIKSIDIDDLEIILSQIKTKYS